MPKEVPYRAGGTLCQAWAQSTFHQRLNNRRYVAVASIIIDLPDNPIRLPQMLDGTHHPACEITAPLLTRAYRCAAIRAPSPRGDAPPTLLELTHVTTPGFSQARDHRES